MKSALFLLLVFSLLSLPSVWAGSGYSSSKGHKIVSVISSNQNSMIVCASCHFQNPYGTRYCGHCRVLLSVEVVGIPCSYCSFVNQQGASFCSSCGQSLVVIQEVYVLCTHCHKKYKASPSGCPHCVHEEEIIHYETQILPPYSIPSVTVRSSTSVLLDTFYKDSFGKERKEYNISGYTNGCSFCKLIVDVKVNEKFAVILNSVQVRVDGNWQQTTIGSRLKNGRNEFPVNVPAGATELVCSFTHGFGSDVSVSLAN